MSLEYKLVRSRRKTTALYVLPDGSLLVRAPLRAPKKLLNAFVISKAEWIEKQRLRLGAQKLSVCLLDIVKTGKVIFQGSEFPLELVDETSRPFYFNGKIFFLARNYAEQSSKLVETWYRAQARKILKERISWFSSRYHFHPKKLRISSAKTRWGSCSSKGTISFTWRLIMTHPDVVDYVVVHELVHLVERNHQKPFWNKVADIIPDYKVHRNWLKKHGKEIMENTHILEE